jgi:predicted metal-binding membrane protein
VISSGRRVAPAAAVRVTNAGANPRLTSAIPPFRSNTRLEIIAVLPIWLPMLVPMLLPMSLPMIL